ncbi:TetR/AcrR family transcriptional regulator [Micrococcus terreus]|uniref:Transcriptional regulator, TetR family n=1 Tax=Micrococcus terreus TaxID=574650 RepID=A0A1I7MJV2_9MICC|nr:TetR/AcrR family transcriptional regulator [Micrococcus terreus]SFV22119.1 transcriptional regulator, TetR family [Micrococcus terreus]
MSAEQSPDPAEEPARRGRPRSEASRLKVLTAAARLMVEGGFEHLTVEGIAAEAGVAKQTVYRWWGSKADVVVETIADGHLPTPVEGPEDTGDLRADVRAWLEEIFGAVELGDTSRLVRALLAALASASETAAAINAALIEPIQEGLRERFVLEAQRRPGALPSDPGFLADTVGASVLLHIMLGDPLEQQWMQQLLDLVAPAGSRLD